MPKIPAHQLAQAVIVGGLCAAFVCGLAYLILGDLPPWWVLMLAAEALLMAVTLAAGTHRRHAADRLQAAFDQPAFGEDR